MLSWPVFMKFKLMLDQGNTLVFALILLCNTQKIMEMKILNISYFWGAEHKNDIKN
jgi:hypothetical protein